ncbi:Sexual development regulator VELC [Ceratocystis fimbriata CBS 114723]|uniref:Sexual development regulator VELC n=1 Tax=Ceratocystis fimbriata CBS 114723 TaxID=1035309 RepID=A0A2C5XG27_9PEZI|nr:Sexual development regulator VELC [Ceratocystis fimbriata CBS 114723]
MNFRSDSARDLAGFAGSQAPIRPALTSSPDSPSRIVSFVPATDPNQVSHPVSSLSLPPLSAAAAAATAAHPYSSHPYANSAVNPMARYEPHLQPGHAHHGVRSGADNGAFHTYPSSYMHQQQHSSSIYNQAPLPLPDARSHPESQQQPVNAQYPTQTPTPVFSPHFDHLDKAARHPPASQAASRSDLQQRQQPKQQYPGQRLEPHSTAPPLPPPPHPGWPSINRYSTLQPSSVASSPTYLSHLPHSHATQAASGQGYPSQPQPQPQQLPPRQGLANPNLSPSPRIAHAHPAGIRLSSIHSSGPVRSPTVLSSPVRKRPEPYTPAQSYKPLPDGPCSPRLLPFGPACDTYNTKPTATSTSTSTSASAPATASISTPSSSTSSTERLKQEGIKISDILSPDSAPGALVAAKATKRTQKSAPAAARGRPSKRRTAMEPPPTHDDSNVEYHIFLRQQPIAARSCGFGERDRRTINPPPIVQMTMTTTPPLKPGELAQRIQGRAVVVHCSVWNEAGDTDCSAMPAEYRSQRRLMGTLVSSPFVGKDENGEEGCFFCFPDLSCRTPGSFRLRFAMVIIDPKNSQYQRSFPIRGHAMSTPFTVYNAKDFPGMRASTPLTHCLREQGCLISIKKGNTRAGGDQDAQEDHNTDGDGEAKTSDSKLATDAEDSSQRK